MGCRAFEVGAVSSDCITIFATAESTTAASQSIGDDVTSIHAIFSIAGFLAGFEVNDATQCGIPVQILSHTGRDCRRIRAEYRQRTIDTSGNG
jgi:hypothetical protein